MKIVVEGVRVDVKGALNPRVTRRQNRLSLERQEWRRQKWEGARWPDEML